VSLAQATVLHAIAAVSPFVFEYVRGIFNEALSPIFPQSVIRCEAKCFEEGQARQVHAQSVEGLEVLWSPAAG
jgi:hypothetical protein